MAPIKNKDVERLAAEVSEMTGESQTEAIREALEERKQQLLLQRPKERGFEALMAEMERHVWSKLPPDQRGKPISQEEQDEILGYGSDGV